MSVSSSESESQAALTELEKGLRSAKVGEQAEAIVRFPHLFSQYPFPILINSGMMKLAELFKQGSNFLKICVLRVFQQSSLHLDKVTSVDEFLRRVITVINSNDPVARALTLRVIGAIAPIIAERKSVHHKVRCSLDSQDQVELLAGIFAAKKLAATSSTFATDMCACVMERVTNPATSLPVKLRLVPILQHMHHSADTAAQVRSCLASMLPLYPGQALLTLALRTLTSLAINTRVDIPDQVTLLLDHLGQEARLQVRLSILSDLSLLAKPDTAHLWTRANLEAMVKFALAEESEQSLVRSVDIIRDILVAGDRDLELDTVVELCESVAYSESVRLAARGVELLTAMACGDTGDTGSLGETACLAIQNLCYVASNGESEVKAGDLKRCLACILRLCAHPGHAHLTGQFVDILGGMLTKSEADLRQLHAVVGSLASLADTRAGSLAPLVPDITGLVTRMAKAPASRGCEDTLVLVLTTLLQTLRGSAWPPSASQAWSLVTASSPARLDCWHRFRLARAASRYGHHGLASSILTEIAGYVDSDSSYAWLEGLGLLTSAENTLVMTTTSSLQDRLSASLNLFHRAMSSLRCAATPSLPLVFQLEMVRCRTAMVTSLAALVSAASSLSTSPPPAIAVAHAQQSRDELQRCGRVTPQLRKVIRQLETCASDWARLAQSSFDADNRSLALLSVQQQTLSSLATWIEMVVLKSSLQGNIYTHTELEFVPDMTLVSGQGQITIELAGIIANIQGVAARFRALEEDPSPLAKPISHLHTACLQEVVASITSHPFPYPRFFYQSLQQTKIKLQVSPQPKTSGEPVAVNTSQFLAVKVEGVIQRSRSDKGAKEGRQVAGVVVQLNSVMQEKSKGEQGAKGDVTTTNLEQEAEPHHDFFTVQFLVPFPVAGLYTCTLDTRWRDREGRTWDTGSSASLTVKSFEDRSGNTRTGRG